MHSDLAFNETAANEGNWLKSIDKALELLISAKSG
jgi:hypothetical protein